MVDAEPVRVPTDAVPAALQSAAGSTSCVTSYNLRPERTSHIRTDPVMRDVTHCSHFCGLFA